MTANSDRLVDQIITLLDNDGVGEESAYLVLAALESDEALADALGGQYTLPKPNPTHEIALPEPVGAFLRSIFVAGFRGIGKGDTLDLHPAPGLTVVAGRNGSGKSTYAEALEVALTSNSYRWQARAAAWQRNWANLHTPRPREIRVALAEDGVGTTTVGVDWPADTERFADLRCWVQRPGRRRETSLHSLGWADAIDLYRPILSYEELGGLLTDAPSKLYDALVAILGLDQVADAQKRLDMTHARVGAPAKQEKDERRELKKLLAESDDLRAEQALTLLRKRVLDFDSLRRLAIGSDSAATGVVARLQELAEFPLLDREVIEQTAGELRAAVRAVAAHRDTAAERADRRLALLREAVDFHAAHDTDVPCPVCGQGMLDDAWRTAVEAELLAESEAARVRQEAQQHLSRSRDAARRLVTAVGAITPVPGVELATVEQAAAARSAWLAAPQDDIALAEHLAAHGEELHVVVSALRAEAATAHQARQDAWSPLATRLAAWLQLAEQARAIESQVEQLRLAASWLREHASQLRNQQLEPLAAEAREVWSALRQESNVDLKSIIVPATSPKFRHVEIGAEVDGADAGALGVMSTGELHALALALFLPRATRPESPFRFVVLDDPIQAMDPSKIDGFVQVLARLAATRQVVVLSHDDRLPDAVRRLVPGARIIEVDRSAGSIVSVADAEDPAQRDIEDARALASDPNVKPEIQQRVLPGLCRSAFEAAARDAWYARAHSAGIAREAVESTWAETRNQPKRIALALYGDADRSIDKWLDGEPYRRPAVQVVGRGVHEGMRRDPKGALRDVERLVADLRAGAR